MQSDASLQGTVGGYGSAVDVPSLACLCSLTGEGNHVVGMPLLCLICNLYFGSRAIGCQYVGELYGDFACIEEDVFNRYIYQQIGLGIWVVLLTELCQGDGLGDALSLLQVSDLCPIESDVFAC